MNEILKYEGREVRMVMQDDEPWWVVKDVCDALGIANPSDAVKKLDHDDLGLTEVIDAIGRKQKTYITNEAGLYTLILRSDKPEAKKFKRWITHEVLPSIRKTGSYQVAPQNKFALMRQMLDAWEYAETRLIQHDTQLAVLESRVDLFGADTNYRTVRAYCNQNKIPIPERHANTIGRRAGAICRERGIRIGRVADERHGEVNSYPVDVIAEAVAGLDKA